MCATALDDSYRLAGDPIIRAHRKGRVLVLDSETQLQISRQRGVGGFDAVEFAGPPAEFRPRGLAVERAPDRRRGPDGDADRARRRFLDGDG